MRATVFAKRCAKEVLRDPLTIIFGIGFPVVVLLLLSVMNLNIPQEAEMALFKIENLAPGVMVFGFSFLALFGGLLLSTDRDTAFLTRLYTSPLRASDFLVGYALPLVPIGLVQVLSCIVVAFKSATISFSSEKRAIPRTLEMLSSSTSSTLREEATPPALS